jgi:undecaprenyl diphosphate synthase
MTAMDDFVSEASRKMDKSLESAAHEFNTVRTGRASAALLDRIQIDYYGTMTPLQQLATVNVPEPRLITIQPYDPGSIKSIERAIQESDLGLTPSNDGKLIRLPIPQLTEERRKELVKVVRGLAEEGRVAVRNVRRDATSLSARKPRSWRSRSLRTLSLLTKLRTFRALRPLPEGELPDVARSIAIIMDGNGRWARRRRLPVAAGHRAGTRALRRTVEAAIDLGVESLCVYAFSTENWSRPPDEVDALMEIFVETIERELPDLQRQGVHTRFIGRRDRASGELQAKMAALEEETEGRERLQLWIAFDYGGRAEIVEATRRIVEEGLDPRDIDENAIGSRLYAPEMPEPDLLIRTSGERRVSNFLLWQLAYTELVFVDTLWPDFGERQLRQALVEYAGRRRRFGGR